MLDKIINFHLLTPINIVVIGAILFFLSAGGFAIFASANFGKGQ